MATNPTHHRSAQHQKLTNALQALTITLPAYTLLTALTGWGTHITGAATITATVILWALIPKIPTTVMRTTLWGTLLASSVLLATTGTPLLAANVTAVALCITGITAYRNHQPHAATTGTVPATP